MAQLLAQVAASGQIVELRVLEAVPQDWLLLTTWMGCVNSSITKAVSWEMQPPASVHFHVRNLGCVSVTLLGVSAVVKPMKAKVSN